MADATYDFQFGGDGSTIQVDTGLDDIHVKELPKFEIAVTEVPALTLNSNLAVTKLPTANANVTTNSNVTTSIAITEIPPINSNVSIAVTEIPEQRVHVPTHYQVGFSLFGIEIWSLSLCGETQVINEKYVPRRTEICN
jgi:hypothetical protein